MSITKCEVGKVSGKNKKEEYAIGQQDIICRTLGVSPDPDAPGFTAYEAVCLLIRKAGGVERVGRMLKKLDKMEIIIPIYL